MHKVEKRTHRSLMFIPLCLWCFLGVAAAQAQGDPASELIQLVNQLRISYGVPPYEVNPILVSVAQAQASWSAANNHIGHDGPGGSTPNERAQAAGYGGGSRSYATENAAHGTASYNTPQLVVTMMQGDWVHLNAMISPDYEHIGVGFAEAGGYSWYVMMAGWVEDGSYPDGPGSAKAPETSVPYVPFAMSEPDETGAIYHEVQPGQTAWTIAAYYKVDLAELLALNNLTENPILHPGDILLIHPPESPTSTPTFIPSTEVTLKTPTTPTSVSSATSTPTPSTDSQTSQPSRLTPFLLIIGLGIAVLVGIALIQTVWSRTQT
jgi:LysM repeat protein